MQNLQKSRVAHPTENFLTEKLKAKRSDKLWHGSIDGPQIIGVLVVFSHKQNK